MSDEKKNKWRDALEAQPRWHLDVDVSGMVNHDGSAIPKVRVHILTKQEEIDAVKAAHAEAASESKGADDGGEACREDPEFTVDMKTVQALWRAFRDPADPKSDAFVSPQWMKRHLTAHQIAYLLNVYNDCKAKAAKLALKLDAEQIAAYRDGCVAVFDSALPEQLLAPLPREQLTTLAIMMAKSWHDEREALLARVEELEGRLGAAENTISEM